MYKPDMNDATDFEGLKEYVEKEFRKLSGALLVGETDSLDNRIWTELPPRPYDGVQVWLHSSISPVGHTGPHYYENNAWRFMGVSDFLLEVSKGNVPGHSYINKFGRNTDIDTSQEDIWDGGGTYTFSTTADIDNLVSSNVGDTMEIEVQGLDTNWDEVIQNITLTGITSVALTTSLIRVFRMRNISATAALGNIQVGVGATTTSFAVSNLRAQITQGFEQTLMAIYSIPRNKTAYAINYWANINKANASGALDVSTYTKTFGGVFRIGLTTGLIGAGSSHFQHLWQPYPAIPEKSDIKTSGIGSTNNFDVSAGFDLLLVDNA